MRNIIGIILFALALSLGAHTTFAASREKAVAVFTVSPKMSCQNCENKIKSNLRFEKGISEITTDLRNQTVTIKYDASKTDVAAIEKAFRKIGYLAAEVSADTPCPADSCQASPCCR